MNLTEQLKRDGHLLNRSGVAGKKPKKRVPAMSPKRQKESREYSAKRKAYLAAHSVCEIGRIGCTRKTTDVHHTAKRGRNLNNVDTWLPVCRSCHDWVHAHPSEARKLGYLL